MQLLRKISVSGALLLALLLITTMWVGVAGAAPAKVNPLHDSSRSQCDPPSKSKC